MPCWCLSLTASQATLEQREELFQSWIQLAQVFPSIFLATCQRLELYFHEESSMQHVLHWIQHLPQVVEYRGAACLEHLISVTAGWESAFFGESEIQGQVKRAYAEAAARWPLPSALHFLFQKSLRASKRLRQQSPSVSSSSIAQVASQLLLQHTDPGGPIALVGASSMNRAIAYALQGTPRPLILLSRHPKKAGRFPAWVQQVEWEERERALSAQALCCATRSDGIWIDRVGAEMRFILDLSVPRRVSPQLAHQVSLLNVDQLFSMGGSSIAASVDPLELQSLADHYLKIWSQKQEKLHARVM